MSILSESSASVRRVEQGASLPLPPIVLESKEVPSVVEKTAQLVFSTIATFGDSLSDSGNAYSLWRQETTPPYDTLDELLVPQFPYSMSDHRYCNGPTWIELFAKAYGCESNSQPALAKPNTEALNFAVGRARARNTPDTDLVNFPSQVERFLHQTKGVSLENTLCVIEIGGNDIRDALSACETTDPAGIISEAAKEVGNAVNKLYGMGAKKFLVWTIPDIGKTPAIRSLNRIHPGISSSAQKLTEAYNTGLKAHIKALSELQGITIRELNVHGTLDHMVARPEEHGLRVVDIPFIKQPCSISPPQDPDAYLFWDGIHPTKIFHQAVAKEAVVVVSQ